MQAAAHTKGGFGGVPQAVGKEFVGKDSATPGVPGHIVTAKEAGMDRKDAEKSRLTGGPTNFGSGKEWEDKLKKEKGAAPRKDAAEIGTKTWPPESTAKLNDCFKVADALYSRADALQTGTYADADWTEGDHPRGEDGKFGSGGGGGGTKSSGGTSSAFASRRDRFSAGGGKEPSHGETIGSHTDKDGYTSIVRHGVSPEDRDGHPARIGTKYIRSPDGSEVKAGYFMDWPEDPKQSLEDYFKKTPYKERAQEESDRQATRYKPLKDQVNFHKRAASRSDASDHPSEKVENEVSTVGSAKREDLPSHIFLQPGERKYPVKEKKGDEWVYSRALLISAEREANAHGHKDIARKADAIREREFDKADERQDADPYTEGQLAKKAKKSNQSSPYREKSKEDLEWQRGWQQYKPAPG